MKKILLALTCVGMSAAPLHSMQNENQTHETESSDTLDIRCLKNQFITSTLSELNRLARQHKSKYRSSLADELTTTNESLPYLEEKSKAYKTSGLDEIFQRLGVYCVCVNNFRGIIGARGDTTNFHLPIERGEAAFRDALARRYGSAIPEEMKQICNELKAERGVIMQNWDMVKSADELTFPQTPFLKALRGEANNNDE